MSTAIEETIKSPVVEEREELQQTPLSPVADQETVQTPKAPPQQEQRPPSRDSDKDTVRRLFRLLTGAGWSCMDHPKSPPAISR